MYDGPRIADEVNPTQDEIRAWAYSGAVEPMQDWDILVAEPENLDLLLELVGDTACPARQYLLGSLYCTVGHSDRNDSRLMKAATDAAASPDGQVSAWGRRAGHVLTHPSEFNRADWCGWQGDALDTQA